MTMWFHSTLLATSLVATIAVGVAGAAIYVAGQDQTVAAKADRLPVLNDTQTEYVTIETRSPGLSILNRMPVERVAAN